MTIQNAIDRVDRLRPNRVPVGEKIRWLCDLDRMVMDEVILCHEPGRPPVAGDAGKLTPEEARELQHPADREAVPFPVVARPIGERKAAPAAQVSYPDYHGESDMGTELLVREPYTDVYLWWLCSQMDLVNAETDRYANDRTMFNSAWNQYSDWYTRTHMPIQKTKQFHM